MKKLSLVAIAGVMCLGMGAAVAPASAASIASCENSVSDDGQGNHVDAITSDASAIIAGLRAKGVNVQDVQDWGGCVKADVVRPNGSTAMEFFDPSSLERLHRNG